MPGSLLGLVLGGVLVTSGCAGTGDEKPSARARPPVQVQVVPATPPPWESAEGPAVAEPREGRRVLFDDPGTAPVLFSQNPELMRAEVASECLAARTIKPRDSLGSLVVGLYLSVVDPAEGTEALIQGECAPTTEIVREMVAKGGEDALAPVIERARALSPPKSQRAIEAAASEGLARYAAARGLDVGLTRGTRRHAMAYHPSAGGGVRIEQSTGQDELLYRQAVPGYGIYTFVLFGAGVERLPEADLARARELLRLIETYAGVGPPEASLPSGEAHVFLVPVDAELGAAPLFSQVAIDLAERMRRSLMQTLPRHGQATLAKRLELGTGPFLVASLAPNLVPRGASTPLLIADLSGLGIEHLYSIVDAFDRPIPVDLSGRTESLIAIQRRLEGVRPAPASGADQVAAAWVFMIGASTQPPLDSAGARPVLGAASRRQAAGAET